MDDARISRASIAAKGLVFTSTDAIDLTRIREFISKPLGNSFCCGQSAQTCEKTAIYLTFIHSAYDMSLRDMADIMQRKKAITAYGVMMFSPDIMEEENGVLQSHDAYFKTIGEKIEFGYHDDPSHVYVHNKIKYLSKFSTMMIISSNGARYHFEPMQIRGEDFYFKIYPAMQAGLPDQIINHNIWFNARKGQLLIQSFVLNYESYLKTNSYPDLFTPIHFYCDSSLFDAVLYHALGVTENKFKPVEIFNFARSKMAVVVYGKEIVHTKASLSPEYALHLANVVYMMAFIQKHDQGRVLQEIMSSEKYRRDIVFASLWKKIFTSRKHAFETDTTFGFGFFHAALFDFLTRKDKRFLQFVKEKLRVRPCSTVISDADIRTFPTDQNTQLVIHIPDHDPEKYMRLSRDILKDLFGTEDMETGVAGFDAVSVSSSRLDAVNRAIEILDKKIRQAEDSAFENTGRHIFDKALKYLFHRLLKLCSGHGMQRFFYHLIKVTRRVAAMIDHLFSTQSLVSTRRQVCVEDSVIIRVRPNCSVESIIIENPEPSESKTEPTPDPVPSLQSPFQDQDQIFHSNMRAHAESSDILYNSNKKQPKAEGTINRTQTKATNLLQFLLQDEYKLGSVALDLCSGPGGSLAVWRDHFETTYYHDYDKASSHLRVHKPCTATKINGKSSGDLLDPKQRIVVRDTISKQKAKPTFCFADGCLDSLEIDREASNLGLLHGQIEVILSQMSTLLTVVLKVFSLVNPGTYEMLRPLLAEYSRISVYRDKTTPSCSNEYYIILSEKCETRPELSLKRYESLRRSAQSKYNRSNILTYTGLYKILGADVDPSVHEIITKHGTTLKGRCQITFGHKGEFPIKVIVNREYSLSFDNCDKSVNQLIIKAPSLWEALAPIFAERTNQGKTFTIEAINVDYPSMVNLLHCQQFQQLRKKKGKEENLLVGLRLNVAAPVYTTRFYDFITQKGLTVRKARGDGWCLYHSLLRNAQHSDTSKSLEQIKKEFTDVVKDHPDYHTISTQITHSGYGGTRSIDIYAESARVNVVVMDCTTCTTSIHLCRESNHLTPVRYLCYDGDHYDFFEPYQCMEYKTSVVTRSSEVTLGGSPTDSGILKLRKIESFSEYKYRKAISSDDGDGVFFVHPGSDCSFHLYCCHNGVFALAGREDFHKRKRTIITPIGFNQTNVGVFQNMKHLLGYHSFISIPGEKESYCVVFQQHLRSIDYLFQKEYATLTNHHLCKNCAKTTTKDLTFVSPTSLVRTFCAIMKPNPITPVEHFTTSDIWTITVSPDFTFKKNMHALGGTVTVTLDSARTVHATVFTTLEKRLRALYSVVQLRLGIQFDPNIPTAARAEIENIFMKISRQLQTKLLPFEQKVAGFSQYKPVPFTIKYGYMDNAVREIQHIWKISVAYIESNHRSTHHEICTLRSEGFEKFNTIKPMNVEFGLFNTVSGRWIIKPQNIPVEGYSHGFDGENIVELPEFEWSNRPPKFKCKSLFVSVSRGTKFVAACRLLPAVPSVLGFTPPKIFLIEGIPGSGKTEFILRNMGRAPLVSGGDLVLTTTRNACQEMHSRFGVSNRDKIRTGDSFLMSGDKLQVDVLWIDECLMKHAGEIVCYIDKVRPKIVYLLGDSAQIPYSPRITGLTAQFSSFYGWPVERVYLDVSHRCPQDVVSLIDQYGFYPVQISTTSEIKKSIRWQFIKTYCDVPLSNKRNQYLVFSQDEKKEISHRFPGVQTVHEFQGGEQKKITLMRVNNKPAFVFNSRPHQLVALTRHRETFTYYSVVADHLTDMIDNHKFKTLHIQPDKVEQKMQGLRRVVFGERLKGGGKKISDPLPLEYLLRFIPERTIDMLRVDKRIRAIIDGAGCPNVVPLRPEFTHIHTPTVERPFIQCREGGDVTVLQGFYDRACPGASLIDTRYLHQLYEYTPTHMRVEDISISYAHPFRESAHDYLTAELSTMAPRPTRTSTKTLIKAFMERNGSAPDYVGDQPFYHFAQRLCENFVATYIEDVPAFEQFKRSPVLVNSDSIQSWLESQPPAMLDLISLDDETIHMKDLTRYEFILKRVAKIVLDRNASDKYPSPQTIAHLSKLVNGTFCPIVRELKHRLLAVLRKNSIVYTDMSTEDFERLLSHRFPPRMAGKYRRNAEIDFSKYDKSQNYTTLIFELFMLEALGMPVHLLGLWAYAHITTLLFEHKHRFRGRVNYQRKSGDAMTFFGNTLYLMAIIAWTFELCDTDFFGCFSGDDVFLWSKHLRPTVEHIESIQTDFNMETKLIEKDTPYFCSKFLVAPDDDHWIAAPDTVKLVTKLGRNDLVNFQHVEEYRRSCADLMSCYRNEYNYHAISQAINDRYSLQGDHTHLFRTIMGLIDDPFSFRDLYYIRDGDNLGDFTILPSLDI